VYCLGLVLQSSDLVVKSLSLGGAVLDTHLRFINICEHDEKARSPWNTSYCFWENKATRVLWFPAGLVCFILLHCQRGPCRKANTCRLFQNTPQLDSEATHFLPVDFTRTILT
jgi:hypothetical protein